MTNFGYPKDNKDDVLEELLGVDLPEGWKVDQRLTRKAFQSGSCFSVGYVVKRGEEKAFMKAFDFFGAMQQNDPIAALNELTETYLFERELLESCGAAKMTKVVRAISSGTVDDSRAPLGKVFYLLFELAESDVRAHLVESNRGLGWRIRCLHHISTALQQLHKRGIYHQDLKPSNVLVFTKGEESKLGDLGRAHWVAKSAPHDVQLIPGAFRYAPPELLYGAPVGEALAQKAASDLYLFGSMISYFATGMAFTPMLLKYLLPEHQPFVAHGAWRGFFRDVLPYVVIAHEKAVKEIEFALKDELKNQANSDQVVSEIIQMLRYCSNPDPLVRGHPATRRKAHGNQYDIERFVAMSDLVARRLEIRMR